MLVAEIYQSNERKSDQRNQSDIQPMNLIAWLLSLTLMVILMVETVAFYQATVCRQKAWLKGTELITRNLLDRPLDYEQRADLVCKIYVTRIKKTVTWQRLPNPKKHQFRVDLMGKL